MDLLKFFTTRNLIFATLCYANVVWCQNKFCDKFTYYHWGYQNTNELIHNDIKKLCRKEGKSPAVFSKLEQIIIFFKEYDQRFKDSCKEGIVKNTNLLFLFCKAKIDVG